MTNFDATRKLYNKYAAEFAAKFEKIPELQQLNEFIAMLPTGATILDLGCGSGRDAEYLASKGFRVTGVDLSEKLIEEAIKRRPTINFQVMDIEHIDFPKNTFDGVWSKLAILHVDRKNVPSVILSALTILKPGGLLMAETKAGTGEDVEPVSFSKQEERFFVYYELNELIDIFNKGGFTNVHGYDYTVGNEHATTKKDRIVVWGRKPTLLK